MQTYLGVSPITFRVNKHGTRLLISLMPPIIVNDLLKSFASGISVILYCHQAFYICLHNAYGCNVYMSGNLNEFNSTSKLACAIFREKIFAFKLNCLSL